MSGESFGRDPRFPHRPQHPDFDRLGRVVRAQDAAAEARGIDAALGGIIDPDVASYVAYQRVLRVPGDSHPVKAALWLDGFAAGVAYAREQEKEE